MWGLEISMIWIMYKAQFAVWEWHSYLDHRRIIVQQINSQSMFINVRKKTIDCFHTNWSTTYRAWHPEFQHTKWELASNTFNDKINGCMSLVTPPILAEPTQNTKNASSKYCPLVHSHPNRRMCVIMSYRTCYWHLVNVYVLTDWIWYCPEGVQCSTVRAIHFVYKCGLWALHK